MNATCERLGGPDPYPRSRVADQMLLEARTTTPRARHSGSSANFAVDHELMAMREQVEQARISRQRYEFALSSYEQLMRHRIANPLAVICGVAQTLRDKVDLGEVQQSELLDSLLEQASNLRQVMLEPRATTAPEHVLEPWPNAADHEEYEA